MENNREVDGMMKKIILLISIFQMNVSLSQEGCFPSSPLRFSAQNKSLDGITEIEFNQLLERVQITMGPEIKKILNKKLIITLAWNDPTVDAHATRDDDNNAVIIVNGGLARHPLMTRDGLLLVACHEIGHHLGGAPKAFRGTSNLRGWSSAEGQADYFATTKCLPRIFSDGLDIKTTDSEIDNVNLKSALLKCRDDICVRIALAGLSVSKIFASLKIGTPDPKILKNDLTVMSKTIYAHPNPQCRLDTYLSGANCDVSIDIPFDNHDHKLGACLSLSKGARPSCWFSESYF